jgi:hypothetical protein
VVDLLALIAPHRIVQEERDVRDQAEIVAKHAIEFPVGIRDGPWPEFVEVSNAARTLPRPTFGDAASSTRPKS